MKMKTFFFSLIVLSFVFSNCQDAPQTAKSTNETSRLAIAARNKATFIKSNAAYNEKRFDEGILYYATNFEKKSEKREPGRAGVKASWENSYKLWPDNKVIIERIVTEDDWVMVNCKATATHTNVVMGVQPTNKKLEAYYWEAVHFDKDGLIVESWSTLDNTAMLQQLGLLPTAK
jgi:predicted ester cyclase